MSSGRKAIIIEDDLKQAEIFYQALVLVGFEAEIISDGAAAALVLESAAPDLVLLDLNLPHVKGEKLLEQIRTLAHLKETKVILSTADPRRADALRETSDLVLIKPISFNQLCELAARMFKN
ncbi:MAG: response regulator [Anaerolineales bacterium]|nr:response regulator [Anaerolineales bacterium]